MPKADGVCLDDTSVNTSISLNQSLDVSCENSCDVYKQSSGVVSIDDAGVKKLETACPDRNRTFFELEGWARIRAVASLLVTTFIAALDQGLSFLSPSLAFGRLLTFFLLSVSVVLCLVSLRQSSCGWLGYASNCETVRTL